MLQRARRVAVQRLPEPVLYSIEQAWYGELPWQERLARAATASLARAKHPAPSDSHGTSVTPRGVRAQRVENFDAWAARKGNVTSVTQVLDACGIGYALVPGVDCAGPRVAVAAEDRPAVGAALASALSGQEWVIEDTEHPSPPRRPGWSARPVAALPLAWLSRRRSVRVYRWLVTPSDVAVGGSELACVLDFWERIDTPDVPRRDGGTYSEGTRVAPFPRRTIAGYLEPRSWTEAITAPGHWPQAASLPSLFRVREPIDFVYTWVDGNDPQWRARRAAHHDEFSVAELNTSATHDSRYLSRDELRYSLRSVAMYASWVRKIYIVTDRQVPCWLDVDHPMIEVVDHAKIFGDTAALPVFNSHAIESQLHHIPGLSERYLYLNDDVFFARPVTPELFFHGNGLAKFFLSPAPLDLGPPSSRDLPVMSAAKQNRALIEREFGATVTNKFRHTPHPQLRTVLEDMERSHPDVFDTVARSRFRHPADVSIASALSHYYGYALGRATPARIQYKYHNIALADTRRWLSTLLRTRDADVFCLNDEGSDPATLNVQSEILTDFLKQYFPAPSQFEKA